MKNITINYKKGVDINNLPYYQTIKLNKKYLNSINKKIYKSMYKAKANNLTYTRDHLKPLNDNQLKGLETITLSQLDQIMQLLQNKSNRRILWRNTRIVLF